MSDTLQSVRALVTKGAIVVSRHGFQELAADDILLDEILVGIDAAVIVEDYPVASKGPSVLVLRWDSEIRPLHVVWGIEKGTTTPAVLITAYRPAPAKWSPDFRSRRKS